eukprot:TRINITY_DN62076_c0_g1_i1.p1 TRINITY_DN62076_c0_g1~~TRINITY_DN62076_c0_g1_i1.p1  ORF type:complete len:522 (+),score=92.68 TRINITY_DN62076_c0_g1_i1:164-1729(+)
MSAFDAVLDFLGEAENDITGTNLDDRVLAGIVATQAAAGVGVRAAFQGSKPATDSTTRQESRLAWTDEAKTAGSSKDTTSSKQPEMTSLRLRQPGFTDEFLHRLDDHMDTPEVYGVKFVLIAAFCVFIGVLAPLENPWTTEEAGLPVRFLYLTYPIQQVIRSATATFMLLAWFDIHEHVPNHVFYSVIIIINAFVWPLYIKMAQDVAFPVPFFDMLTSPMLVMPAGIGVCMFFVVKFRQSEGHFQYKYVKGTLLASFLIFVPVFVMGMPLATFLFRLIPSSWQFVLTASFPLLRTVSDKILLYGLGPNLYPGTAFIWVFCTSVCYEMFVTSQFANFSSPLAVAILVGSDLLGNMLAVVFLARQSAQATDETSKHLVRTSILLLVLREFTEAVAPLLMGIGFGVSILNGNYRYVRGWDVMQEESIAWTGFFYLFDIAAELAVMAWTVYVVKSIVPDVEPLKLTLAWLRYYGHRLAVVMAGNAVFHLSTQFYHYGCDWSFQFQWLGDNAWTCVAEHAAGQTCW